jgi:hypothetical protein
MQTAFLLIGASFLSLASAFSADLPKIEVASPAEGVFVTYSRGLGHNTVIELKGGKFRYWFSSDCVTLEKVEYPLEGSYTAEGDQIVIKHPMLYTLVSNWTVRSIDGVVTLWRSDAIKTLEAGQMWNIYSSGKQNFFRTGGGSILVPSKKTAEEAWKSPQFPIEIKADGKAPNEQQNQKTEQGGRGNGE